MTTEIMDEIERYLSSYRESRPITMTLVDEDNSQSDDNKCYNKPWNKMTQSERVNRLMLFHANMVKSYGLNEESSRNLQKTFTQNSESVLANERVVNYDINSCRIVSINGLKREFDTNNFFIESKRDKPEGIKLKIFVKPMKK